jgi:hypothetical protein
MAPQIEIAENCEPGGAPAIGWRTAKIKSQ